MEYSTISYSTTKTPKQRLLENNTVQWFLYGDPNYLKKVVNKMCERMNKDIERQMSNALLYGVSHPEMYK